MKLFRFKTFPFFRTEGDFAIPTYSEFTEHNVVAENFDEAVRMFRVCLISEEKMKDVTNRHIDFPDNEGIEEQLEWAESRPILQVEEICSIDVIQSKS